MIINYKQKYLDEQLVQINKQIMKQTKNVRSKF